MKQLLDFFRDKKVKTVLDVGTGSGDFLLVLKMVFPDAIITGVDPDSDSLNQARELHPEVTFQKMVAKELVFADASFDVVSISMALHHLPEIEKSFEEILRVVKPNGWIIVSELFSDNLNAAQEVHKMFHHFRSKTHRILGVSHNETFIKKQIIEMIESSGIDIRFHFEFNSGGENFMLKDAELELRVGKMKKMLESVNGFAEYEGLKPQIKEFRKNAVKYGFQPATRVVVVGKRQ
jgi:ubiquinone/menaquinone biosynthesis C-methylase UbiE